MPHFTHFFKNMIPNSQHSQKRIFLFEINQKVKLYQSLIFCIQNYSLSIRFGSNKILMFLRTLKVIKKQNKTEISSPNDTSYQNKKSLKKLAFNSIENLYEMRHSSNRRINPEYLLISTSSPFSIKKKNLQTFQNQYIKAQIKKEKIFDQRKQLIKDKIKGKVKEQLADLLKRSDLTHSLSTDIKRKNGFLQDTIMDVEVKGNSLKHSMRASFTQKPELMKLQKIRRSTLNKYSIKESFSGSEKIITGFVLAQSPKNKMKTRRSLSNIVRTNQVASQQSMRNVRSVLDDLRTSGKKDSLSIQPWQFVEDL